jgi:hypothetical protein
MALAVIGGLLFSTVLSLVFVPAMFMLMDDIGALSWRIGKRLMVSSAETERKQDLAGDQRKPPNPAAKARSPADW